MDAKTLVDKIVPEHDRTSCSDEDWHCNEYANDMGYPRCTRCAFLYFLKYEEFPYDTDIKSVVIRYSRNYAGEVSE